MIEDLLILLAASLLAVGLAQRLGLSSIVGFLLVGILFGPHGLALVPDNATIQQIAELGIAFLMFTIGLEFSLGRLFRDRYLVLVVGGLQVMLSGLLFTLLGWLLDLPLLAALSIGMALAMSSTAIVSRLLIEHNETSSRYGQTAICILLFQDLATIVLLLIMPAMAGDSMLSQSREILLALIRGVAVFLVLLFVGRLLFRPLFRFIARLHSPEVFVLTVLVVSVSAAWFAHIMELSLVLGAFMAGAVIGETEYRHQVEADIRPFEDVLLGLFFITIGMLVEPAVLPQIWPQVLLLTLLLITLKAGLISGLLRIAGIMLPVALQTGISLAHAGEFSLVILFIALQLNLVAGETAQIVLSSTMLSMLLAPIIIRYSAVLGGYLTGTGRDHQQRAVSADIEEASRDLSGHVIVCGYGRVGRNIAWYLEQEHVEYIALDLSIEQLFNGNDPGRRVTYGDATRRHILLAAGLERAQAVVITYHTIDATLKTLTLVHELRPDIAVIVRAIDEQYLDELLDAGATEVIPDTLETSLTMAAHVVPLLGVPVARVAARNDRIRADRYRLLRGIFHGQVHGQSDDQMRILVIPEQGYAVGRRLGELALEETYQVTVAAVRRYGIRGAAPDSDMELQAEDALIVHGDPQALARVAEFLEQGPGD